MGGELCPSHRGISGDAPRHHRSSLGRQRGSPPAPVLVPERFLSSAFPLSCGVVGVVAIGLSGLFWALPPCPESPVCKEEFSGCDKDKTNACFQSICPTQPPEPSLTWSTLKEKETSAPCPVSTRALSEQRAPCGSMPWEAAAALGGARPWDFPRTFV